MEVIQSQVERTKTMAKSYDWPNYCDAAHMSCYGCDCEECDADSDNTVFCAYSPDPVICGASECSGHCPVWLDFFMSTDFDYTELEEEIS